MGGGLKYKKMEGISLQAPKLPLEPLLMDVVPVVLADIKLSTLFLNSDRAQERTSRIEGGRSMLAAAARLIAILRAIPRKIDGQQ